MEADPTPSRPFNHTGFAAFLAEHRLVGTRCAQCASLFLPPRPLCPRCYATRMEWQAFSGNGVLEGFTAIHVGLPEMTTAGYSREKPYCTGVVRLVEGPAISALIVTKAGACPQEIVVGMPLRAIFIDRGPGRAVTLAFEPGER